MVLSFSRAKVSPIGRRCPDEAASSRSIGKVFKDMAKLGKNFCQMNHSWISLLNDINIHIFTAY